MNTTGDCRHSETLRRQHLRNPTIGKRHTSRQAMLLFVEQHHLFTSDQLFQFASALWVSGKVQLNSTKTPIGIQPSSPSQVRQHRVRPGRSGVGRAVSDRSSVLFPHPPAMHGTPADAPIRWKVFGYGICDLLKGHRRDTGTNKGIQLRIGVQSGRPVHAVLPYVC